MCLNHKTVEEAEGFYGLDVDFYLNDVSAATAASGSEPSLKLDQILISSIPGFSVEAGNRRKSAACEHKGRHLFRLQNFSYSFKL